MKRSVELLTAAAKWLDDGKDPFCNDFLIKHQVTYDECFLLSEWLATGARIVAYAAENPEAATAAVNGATLFTANRGIAKALATMRDA